MLNLLLMQKVKLLNVLNTQSNLALKSLFCSFSGLLQCRWKQSVNTLSLFLGLFLSSIQQSFFAHGSLMLPKGLQGCRKVQFQLFFPSITPALLLFGLLLVIHFSTKSKMSAVSLNGRNGYSTIFLPLNSSLLSSCFCKPITGLLKLRRRKALPVTFPVLESRPFLH